MRLDPKRTIRGYPTLLVRSTLRCLRGDLVWGEEALEKAGKLKPGTGRALAKALEAEGLIEASRHGGWTVTQAGDTLAVATAARPVSRHTAERALAQFLERVARVNVDPYFLARGVKPTFLRFIGFSSSVKPLSARPRYAFSCQMYAESQQTFYIGCGYPLGRRGPEGFQEVLPSSDTNDP